MKTSLRNRIKFRKTRQLLIWVILKENMFKKKSISVLKRTHYSRTWKSFLQVLLLTLYQFVQNNNHITIYWKSIAKLYEPWLSIRPHNDHMTKTYFSLLVKYFSIVATSVCFWLHTLINCPSKSWEILDLVTDGGVETYFGSPSNISGTAPSRTLGCEYGTYIYKCFLLHYVCYFTILLYLLVDCISLIALLFQIHLY